MDDNNNLTTLSKQITSNTNAGVEKFANSLYREFVEEIHVANMSEIVFKEYFLDFFKKGAQDNNDAPLTLKWLEVSGGPYNGVNIIDNLGNILYTTPGLYARPQASAAVNNVDLNNITANFNLKANRLYNDGINYLENQIGNLNSGITNIGDEHKLGWKNIFLRYSDSPTSVATKAQPVLSDNISAFLDYD